MRDFFIKSLEVLINILMVILILALVLVSIAAMTGMGDFRAAGMGMPGGGVLLGLGILIFGGLYIVLIGGFMYLGLGIYQNTRRTAEAMERMAGRP